MKVRRRLGVRKVSLINDTPYLKLLARLAAAVLLTLALSGLTANAQPTPQSPVPLPSPFTPIVDNAGVIDATTRQHLETIYLNLKERADIEYAILTVDTTNGQDIFDYSLAVARGWNIGPGSSKGQGLLLVVAIQDRKYYTQIGDHLEGDLPDGLAGQIQREKLVPAFKQSKYSQGIQDTIDAYVATLAEQRGFSIDGIDQRKAYRTEKEKAPPSTSVICCGIVLLIVIILIVSSAQRRGGGRGGGGGGLWQALFWGSLLSNMGGGGRRGGSDWGGGGFGGFGGGGGGGGFGGGFGGGGSFGGGGAGGSW